MHLSLPRHYERVGYCTWDTLRVPGENWEGAKDWGTWRWGWGEWGGFSHHKYLLFAIASEPARGSHMATDDSWMMCPISKMFPSHVPTKRGSLPPPPGTGVYRDALRCPRFTCPSLSFENASPCFPVAASTSPRTPSSSSELFITTFAFQSWHMAA